MSIAAPLRATRDGSGPQTDGLRVTQPFNNHSWQTPPITSSPFAVGGNPLLVTVSTSGWTGTAGTFAKETVQLTSSGPGIAAGAPQLFVNPVSAHELLVNSWTLLPTVPASTGATVTASAAQGTNVDQNDFCCLTVYELGLGAPLAVRAVTGPSPAMTIQPTAEVPGGVMLYQPFVSFGGRLLVRVAGSAIAPTNLSLSTLVVDLDGQEVARAEVSPSAGVHAAIVPVSVLVDAGPGSHALVVRALGGTSPTQFDKNDFISALVLEQMGAPDGLEINPLLVNAPCAPQSGGGVAASANFSSGGGALVFWAAASAWTTAAGQLTLAFHLDGVPLTIGAQPANLKGAVNFPSNHSALVANDLVVAGIAAGSHLLELVGDSVTHTDGNDRCSLTVLELGPASV